MGTVQNIKKNGYVLENSVRRGKKLFQNDKNVSKYFKNGKVLEKSLKNDKNGYLKIIHQSFKFQKKKSDKGIAIVKKMIRMVKIFKKWKCFREFCQQGKEIIM